MNVQCNIRSLCYYTNWQQNSVSSHSTARCCHDVINMYSKSSNKMHFVTRKKSCHIWHRQFQFCAGFNEHHELRQNICMNAKDTAWQCGQILSSSCCFDIFLSQQLIQNNNCVLGVCTYFLSKFVVFVENDTKLKSTMPSLCAIEYSELKTESVLASPTNQRPGFQNSFNSQFTLFNCTWAALSNGANRA